MILEHRGGFGGIIRIAVYRYQMDGCYHLCYTYSVSYRSSVWCEWS